MAADIGSYHSNYQESTGYAEGSNFASPEPVASEPSYFDSIQDSLSSSFTSEGSAGAFPSTYTIHGSYMVQRDEKPEFYPRDQSSPSTPGSEKFSSTHPSYSGPGYPPSPVASSSQAQTTGSQFPEESSFKQGTYPENLDFFTKPESSSPFQPSSYQPGMPGYPDPKDRLFQSPGYQGSQYMDSRQGLYQQGFYDSPRMPEPNFNFPGQHQSQSYYRGDFNIQIAHQPYPRPGLSLTIGNPLNPDSG